MATTQKPKTEAHSLKTEEIEERNMEYHKTQPTDRNTKEKNQWRHRTTRKQMKK